MKKQKVIDFQEYLAKQLKNPIIKKYYDKYGKQLEKKFLRIKKSK